MEGFSEDLTFERHVEHNLVEKGKRALRQTYKALWGRYIGIGSRKCQQKPVRLGHSGR